MDKLPVEMLLCIFELLHPIEKRECLLVCRQWLDAIQSNCLWHAVLLSNISMEQLKQKRMKIQGEQTQQLLIENCNQDIDLNSLSFMFPHLRFLYFSSQNKPRLQQEIDVKQFKPWQDRLESITGNNFITNLLNTGTFYKVTNITLSNPISLPNKFVFKSFQNAPALSTLRLEYFNIPFEDFEVLHECTPVLTSLTLHLVVIENSPMPSDISPTTKMKSITAHLLLHHIKQQFDFVYYISQKYINLQHFSFKNLGLNQSIKEDEYFIQFVQPLIQRRGNLIKTLGIKGRSISPEIFPLLDRNSVQLRHGKFNTRDIILFTETLASSNQIEYLHTLSITWSSYVVKLASFKSLVHLKSLKLKYQPDYDIDLAYQIMFDHFLAELSPENLKYLELCNMDLSMMDNMSLNSSLSTPLHSLKLESVCIEQDISDCLSSYCPKMKEIYIGNSRSQDMTLALPDLELDLFETSNSNSKTFLMVEVDNEIYAYDGKESKPTRIRHDLKKSFGNHNLSVYPTFKNTLSTSIAKRTEINLICRSLSTLFIDGRLVLEEY